MDLNVFLNVPFRTEGSTDSLQSLPLNNCSGSDCKEIFQLSPERPF